MKKFFAMLLVACFTLTAAIGCSGDTKKSTKKTENKNVPSARS